MRWITRHRWGVLALLGWVLVLASMYVLPTDVLRSYAMVWEALVVGVCAVFGAGYLLLSRPSRGEDGKRHRESLWWWVPALAGLFLVVALRTLVFTWLIPAPASPSELQVQSYRWGVVVWSSSFFVIVWLMSVWVRLQLKVRRERKTDAAE